MLSVQPPAFMLCPSTLQTSVRVEGSFWSLIAQYFTPGFLDLFQTLQPPKSEFITPSAFNDATHHPLSELNPSVTFTRYHKTQSPKMSMSAALNTPSISLLKLFCAQVTSSPRLPFLPQPYPAGNTQRLPFWRGSGIRRSHSWDFGGPRYWLQVEFDLPLAP